LEVALREAGNPYASLYHVGLETQFYALPGARWNGDLVHGPRVPKIREGKIVRGDLRLYFPPDRIGKAGTSWWDYENGISEAVFFDFDYGHGHKGKALDDDGIRKVDDWCLKLPYVLATTSSSGKGRHWHIQIHRPCQSRAEQRVISRAALITVSRDLGFDLSPFVCTTGGIQNIFSVSGIQLVKAPTE
jgi:hypothetical protein